MGLNGSIENFTIENIIKIFPEFTLVSGNDGISNEVRVVNIIDSPEITNYIKGGEFFLTNAYIYRNSPKKLTKLLSDVASQKGSGLGIVIKQFIDDIPAETIQKSNDLNLPILTIPVDIPFVEIISKIMTRIINRQNLELNRANEIRDQLTKIVLNKGIIEETLYELYKITSVFPFFVTLDFSKIHYPMKKLPYFISSKVNKLMLELASIKPQDIENYIERNYHAEFFITTTEIAGDTVGFLFGMLEKELPSSIILTAFRYATVNLSISLLKTQAVIEYEEGLKRDYFLDIILGANQPKGWLLERAKLLNLDETKDYCIINVEISKRVGAILNDVNKIIVFDNIGKMIHNLLGAKHIKAIYIFRDSNVIFITEEEETKNSEKSFLSILNDVEKKANAEIVARYPGYKVIFGVGTKNNLLDLNKSYSEALSAIRIGKQISASKNFYLYKDINVYKYLFQLKLDEFSENVFDITVRKLLCYDSKNDAKLFVTLDCFLQNLSVSVSANELFIHPNTLRYRLKKIESLTGKKITNVHDRILLEICVQLYKAGKLS